MRAREQRRLLERKEDRGFYWGRRPVLFKAARLERFAGYRHAQPRRGEVMGSFQIRRYFWPMLDGAWGAGLTEQGLAVQRRPRFTGRARNAAFAAPNFYPLAANPIRYWALAVVRYLRIRAYRGQRYRRGFSAHGGRTHTNRATTRRIRDLTCEHMEYMGWAFHLWRLRAPKPKPAAPRIKGLSKRALKGIRHKRGVIRSREKNQEKNNVWR